MTRLHWYIARRYLRAGRGRGLLSLITWIALGGITVGVWALVVVIAVMTGMQEDLRDKILESSPHVIVLQQGASLRLDDWSTVLDSVTEHPDVLGAAPFALSQVSAVRRTESGSYSQPALLYGVSIDTTRVAPTDMEQRIVEGALSLSPPSPGCPRSWWGACSPTGCRLFEGDRLVLVALENLRQDVFGG
jgi:lipoprotein-releasing system permease protein